MVLDRERIIEVAVEYWRGIFLAYYPEVWAVSKGLDRIYVYVYPDKDASRIPSEVTVNINMKEYKVPVQVIIAKNPRWQY